MGLLFLKWPYHPAGDNSAIMNMELALMCPNARNKVPYFKLFTNGTPTFDAMLGKDNNRQKALDVAVCIMANRD